MLPAVSEIWVISLKIMRFLYFPRLKLSTWRPCKDFNFTILTQKFSSECVDKGTQLCIIASNYDKLWFWACIGKAVKCHYKESKFHGHPQSLVAFNL